MRDGALRRVVLNNLVVGHIPKDEDTVTSQPYLLLFILITLKCQKSQILYNTTTQSSAVQFNLMQLKLGGYYNRRRPPPPHKPTLCDYIYS